MSRSCPATTTQVYTRKSFFKIAALDLPLIIELTLKSQFELTKDVSALSILRTIRSDIEITQLQSRFFLLNIFMTSTYLP